MSLTEKIDCDLKAAMRASDKLTLETLRGVKSALKYRQIDKGAPLSDDDAIAVLSTLSKQRRDSIEQFRKGGREDLAQKEEAELQILKGYLPPELAPEELDRLIAQSISESGASGPQDMGKVMRILMPKAKGADGKLVGEKVRAALSGSEAAGRGSAEKEAANKEEIK